ncbi:DUF1542 domain-containing protein, partial [Staphylococcus aureus]|uniref:DUF1542 domain-containing protein n=1 Tax=Staphylococcus aureus TaxID=1280 RepID=UPI00210B1355
NKTNAEVYPTETEGNDNIKGSLPKVQVKPAACQSVGVKAEAQNALIYQSDLSTEEERLAAKHLVEQALNQAIDHINHADKTAQVNQDSINAQNINVKIGNEIDDSLSDISIVTSQYHFDETLTGQIAVIG